MNKEGKNLRRLTYDQFSTFSPTVRENFGQVLYSRWEANDRNAYTCFSLMSMNPDGAHQTEYFGNQSVWPGILFQGREIPGTSKAMVIVGTHKGPYAGELAIIDPDVSTNGSKSVKLIAPNRTADTTKVIEGVEPLFQNPFPFDEEWFLVSWRPSAGTDNKGKFGIYFMNAAGERELLAWDSTGSVSQPVSLLPRNVPQLPALQADYSKSTGEVLLYNA